MKKQFFLVLVLLSPLLFLVYMLFVHEVKDPIKYIYSITGATAITLLYITTSISMIKKRYKSHSVSSYGWFIQLFLYFFTYAEFCHFR